MRLEEVQEDLGQGVSLEMLLIPAGTFMMGSPESEKGRSDNETQHEVTLTKPFYMGKYEATQDQWEAVMGDNPSRNKGTKLPVTDVSWNACQEFIKKLNATTNGGYRLPTEAEWEYACRAGTTTAYSFGDSLTKVDANIKGGIIEVYRRKSLSMFGESFHETRRLVDANINASTKTVGSYKPNAFGLYDMHGNVWEWCEDRKADYPTGALTDPKGPAKGEYRVLRGGSFLSGSKARSSVRGDIGQPLRPIGSSLIGFRLARTK